MTRESDIDCDYCIMPLDHQPKPFEPIPWKCYCNHVNDTNESECHNCGYGEK
jgi:hypothetical protein